MQNLSSSVYRWYSLLEYFPVSSAPSLIFGSPFLSLYLTSRISTVAADDGTPSSASAVLEIESSFTMVYEPSSLCMTLFFLLFPIKNSGAQTTRHMPQIQNRYGALA